MVINPYDNVAEEHVFHFRDGKKAHNLMDLRNVIEKMPLDEFNHHVDEFNNDFANWVEFVYKNPELANDLRKVTTRREILEILDVELGKYFDSSSDSGRDSSKDSSSSSDDFASSNDGSLNSSVGGDSIASEKSDSGSKLVEASSSSSDESPANSSAVDFKESSDSVSKTKKLLFEEPYKPSTPPQTIVTPDGELVHTISTQAVHHFIVKEFVYGVITGFILGFLLMAFLLKLGAFA